MKEHSPDPYQVLHLGPTATAREISHAYRALMRTHHPDTSTPGPVPGAPVSDARELRDIMDAYAVLSDPAKRAAYDRQRQGPPPTPKRVPAPHRPQGPSPQGPSGPSLIIGPVRREYPGKPAPGQQVTGEQITGPWELIHELHNRAAARAGEPPGPGYRILWWFRR